MARLRPNFETPIEELVHSAGQLDDEDQLDLLSPQEFIEAIEPEAQHALGILALKRAQEWLQVAYLCRDELVAEGYLEKSRKRAIDLAQAVPELREVGDVA